MQALKDAGFVLVLILLVATVRFTPQDLSAVEPGRASLSPRTHAAPFDGTAAEAAKPVPAKIGVGTTPEDSIRHWVVNADTRIEAKAAEQCTEILFHIRKVAEQTRNEAIVREAEEVVRALPCSV